MTSAAEEERPNGNRSHDQREIEGMRSGLMLSVLLVAVLTVSLAGCMAEPEEASSSIGSTATSEASARELVWAPCGVGGVRDVGGPAGLG